MLEHYGLADYASDVEAIKDLLLDLLSNFIHGHQRHTIEVEEHIATDAGVWQVHVQACIRNKDVKRIGFDGFHKLLKDNILQGFR